MFKFNPIKFKNTNEYSVLILESWEHFIELRDRFLQIILISSITFVLICCSVNISSEIIIRLIPEIQFFQLSPQDYLINSFLRLLSFSLLFLYPFGLKLFTFFFGPSLILQEKKKIFPLISISILYSVIAIYISFSILAPITFEFFRNYTLDNLEPFWSFNEFSNFLLKLVYINLIIFQLPIFQLAALALKIITEAQMRKYWKLVIFLSFVISGVLTPSTDPFTQILLSLCICILYGSGIFFSKFL